jgi:hypothetical protein
MAVAITRVDLTAAMLRAAAGREKDGSAARRMLAVAMVLDGADRKLAPRPAACIARRCGTGCHRYNAEGLARPARFEDAGSQAKTHRRAADRTGQAG